MASKVRKSSGGQSAAQDAIALLTQDHLSVKKLFADFHALKDHGSKGQKAALVEEICRQLAVHTRVEEEILYPAVRQAVDDDDDMDEALVEHAGAKDLIAQLMGASPGDGLYDARVTVLSEQIDHHVTEEEGCMFAKARRADLDLVELGARLKSRKAELLAVDALESAPSAALNMPPARKAESRRGMVIARKKAGHSKASSRRR